MRTYEPTECRSPDCRKVFTPTHHNQVYCCRECAEENQSRRKQEYRQRKRALKRTHEKSTAAWDRINAFIETYERETGKFLHYGKAVQMMERQEGKRN